MNLGQKLLTILTAENQILKHFGCVSATQNLQGLLSKSHGYDRVYPNT